MLNLVYYYQSEYIVGTLCAQLLQYYADYFETLQLLWSLSVDLHMVRIKY